VSVYKRLAISLDEFFPPVAHTLGDGSRYPGWKMQFHIRVRNQITVLFEVVGDADHLSVSFDYETIEMRHVQPEMKVILCLKGFQLVVGFQQVFNCGLKK